MKTNLDKLLSEYSILSSNHRPTKTRIIDPFHKKLKPFTVRISTSHKSLRALAPREKPAIKLKPRKSNGKRMEKLLAGLGVPLIKLRKSEKNGHILNTPLLKLAEILELPKSQGQRYESYFPVIKKAGDKIDVQLYPVSLLKSNYSRSKRRLLLKKDKPFFTDTSIPLSASATCPQNVTVVYTDGSCKRNGKADSVAGIGVFFGEDDPRNVSERIAGNQTNQRAELHVSTPFYPCITPHFSLGSFKSPTVTPSERKCRN